MKLATRLVLAAAVLLSCCSLILGFPNGAPVHLGTVCNDLVPQHGSSPQPCPAETCDFSLGLVSIDGQQVPEGQENFYRCGSVHRC